jgi:hypothetical protein
MVMPLMVLLLLSQLNKSPISPVVNVTVVSAGAFFFSAFMPMTFFEPE